METSPHHTQLPPAGTGKKLRVAVIGGTFLFGCFLVIGVLPRLHKNIELNAASYNVSHDAPIITFAVPHLVPSADLILPGSTQAIEETTINARTSGYLKHRYVDIGSRVTMGQTLAEIESPEVDQQAYQAAADTAKSQASTGQASADVLQKQAGVSQSKAEMLRSLASLRQSQAGLTGSEAKVNQAKAAEAVAKAKLAQSKQDLEGKKANLLQARTQEEYTSKTVARYDSLLKQGFVAQQEVDQQRAAYDTARAGTAVAQAAIASSEADVEAAQQVVASAHADIDAAISQVEASKQNISAFQAAIASSQSTIDAAKANVKASEANVQAARATVRSSKANELRFNVLRRFESITAPFTGIITSRNVDTGALITSGASGADVSGSTTPHTGLFGIARTDTLRIQVSVPQTYVSSVHPGQKAKIMVREFPNRVFEGIVFQSAGALDASSRTLLTEVRMQNKANTLLPGMYADVVFPAPHDRAFARVPANTLVVDANGTRVIIIDSNDTLHFQPVVLGRDFGKEVEIIKGLTGNERLVTDPSDDLKDGLKVKAVPAPVDKEK